MNAKPSWCHENCPGARKGQGYARDSGNPSTAIAAFIWESPGSDEVQEGEAAVGPTGRSFNHLAADYGLPRDQLLILNTLRCRWGTNEYPKGQLRKDCESACRHWDKDSLGVFGPTVWLVTFHPSSLFRTPQFEPYLRKTLQKTRSFVDKGYKPVVLCGSKALECFAPWLKGGVETWKCTHWYSKDDSKLVSLSDR